MRALISGVNSQDGSYLAEFLLSHGYEVHGTLRRSVNKDLSNLEGLDINIHWATLENYASLYKVVDKVKPHQVYHLAAQSFVTNSFQDEFSTISTNIHGTHFMLDICKQIVPKCKFYFAGTSEMYGNQESPQNEWTKMEPISPYGISKLAGYNLCRYYRDAFKMFICTGIMFNHESPRRGLEFVTKKICEAAKRKEKVRLGNLEAKRDWGYAKDYVTAMWIMLMLGCPRDFVIATGETHSVKEFAELAYKQVGLDYKKYVIVDPSLFRANELNELRGDSTQARIFGWKPKTTFNQLVGIMMEK